MSVELIDNSDEALLAIQEAMLYGLIAGANFYKKELRNILSTGDGQGPSLPGYPPHKQTKMALRRGLIPLADNLKVNVDVTSGEQLQVTVSTMTRYALFLELGTKKMRARPAWLRVLAARQAAIELSQVEAATKRFVELESK